MDTANRHVLTNSGFSGKLISNIHTFTMHLISKVCTVVCKTTLPYLALRENLSWSHRCPLLAQKYKMFLWAETNTQIHSFHRVFCSNLYSWLCTCQWRTRAVHHWTFPLRLVWGMLCGQIMELCTECWGYKQSLTMQCSNASGYKNWIMSKTWI